jgi:hypothetical protein
MLNLFDGESETPELIWNGSMRGQLRKVISQEIDSCVEARWSTGQGNDHLTLEPNIQVKYKELENELFIGGVYVTRFLKEPTYSIRDPTSFLEMLLKRWTHELQMITEASGTGDAEKQSTDMVVGGQDNLQIITDAVVYLCKIRSNLCDKLSQWGYMSRCLSFLDQVLLNNFRGSPLLSVMRILHVAVNSRKNVESLIASGSNDRLHGIVAFTIRAVGDTDLHSDAGFMLEMLKKVFVEALGDVDNAPPKVAAFSQNYAMAPSPAPGEGRVRVNMGDDPLGLGALVPSSSEHPPLQPPQQNYNSTQFNQNQPHQTYGGGTQYQQPFQQQPYNSMQQEPQTTAMNSIYQSGLSLQQQNQGSMPTQHMARFQQPMNQSFASQQHMQQGQTLQYAQQQQQLLQETQQRQVGLGASSSYAQRSAAAHHMRAQQQQAPQIFPGNGSHQNQKQFAQGSINQQGPGTGFTGIYQNPSQQQAFQQHRQQQDQQSVQHQLEQQLPHVQQQVQNSLQQSQGLGYQQTQGQPSYQQQGGYEEQMQLQPPQDGQPQAIQGYGNPQLQQQQQQQQVKSSFQQFQQPSLHQQQQSYQQPQMMQLGLQHPQDEHQQKQQHPQRYMQPQHTGALFVETVTEDSMQQPGSHKDNSLIDHLPQKISGSKEGNGIDARTKPEPAIEAARQAASSQGAPGCAEGRKALLESALLCDLPTYLVESVLENPNLSSVKDPASVKVHAVELLKLLTRDPGYGLKFQLILEKIPAWKRYVSQDHSLFITGAEQKADYFLTDGSSTSPKKLLTQE